MLNKFKEFLILKDLSKNTIVNYMSSIRNINKELNLESLTQENLNTYLVKVKTEKSKSSMNQYKKALIKWVEFTKQDVEIPKFDVIKPDAPEYFSEKYFLEDIMPTVEVIFNDVAKVKTLFYLMFYVGLRVGEIARVKREDFNLEEREVKIHNRKEGDWKVFRFTKIVANLLEAYFDTYEIKETVFDVSEETIQYYCRKISENNGKRIHPHMFRHSFSVMFLKNGGSEANLQKLLGHKSRRSTAIYSELTDEDIKDEYDKYIK